MANQQNYDLSDLAPQVSTSSNTSTGSNYDLSDLSTSSPVSNNTSSSSNTLSSNKPFFANFNTNPGSLISILPKDESWGNAALQAAGAAGMIAAPELEGALAASNAFSKLPNLVSSAANYLGRTAIGTGISTALGGTNALNSDDLQENIGVNALLSGLGPAANIVGKGLQYFKPQQYADQIMNDISGGQTVAQNGRILASKIKNAFDANKNISEGMYNDIFNSAGASNDQLNSDLNGSLASGNYPQQSQKYLNHYDYDLEDLHNNYIENPTLQNAHQLQSQLAYEIRNSPTDSQADKNSVKGLTRARNALVGDMTSSLDNVSPGLGDQYKKATNYYLNNVVPYKTNTKIENIVNTPISKLSGKQVNNLSNEFANPNNDLQKIASDVGPSINNNILYDQLGKIQNMNPTKLNNALSNLKQQGYESYIPQDLQDRISTMNLRSKLKTGLQAAPGAVAGWALGSHFGPIGEYLGSAITGGAGLVTAKALEPLAKNPFAQATMDGLGKTASGTIPVLAREYLANTQNSSS
jgi:hypothetical protein